MPAGAQIASLTDGSMELLKTPSGILELPTHLDAPLRVGQVITSTYMATLRLTPEEAAPLITVIERETDKAFAAAQADPR